VHLAGAAVFLYNEFSVVCFHTEEIACLAMIISKTFAITHTKLYLFSVRLCIGRFDQTVKAGAGLGNEKSSIYTFGGDGEVSVSAGASV
jgi:hypothetical protein